MNITTRKFRAALCAAAACAALLLAGCGGGSSGAIAAGGNPSANPSANPSGNPSANPSGGTDNTSATPTGTDSGPATNTYTAVTLDRASGTLAAGTVVPLACIQGGTVHDGHINGCNAVHLHGTITIAGVGSFDDPDPSNCGQGRIDIVAKGSLGMSCPALATAPQANAPLSVKLDDPKNFGAIMLELTDGSGATTVTDLTNDLSPGVTKLVQTGFSQYTTASVLTYCNRGVNGSGVDQIEHTKTTVSLKLGAPQQYYAECAPAAQQQLVVNLSPDFVNGSFYTDGGASPAAALQPGSNTFNVAVNAGQANMGAVVVGVDGSGNWSSTALTYPTTGTPPAIAADTTSLTPMPVSSVADSSYVGANGYQGISVYALAPGLDQSYDQVNGTGSGTRNLHAVPNLSAIGGVHDIRAMFTGTEAGTNATQSAAVNRYYTTPPATVSFTTAPPDYLGASSYNVADGSNGFTFTNGYKFSDTSLTPVLLSLLAQTGGGSGALHQWRVNDYSDTSTSVDATWPTDYLTSADTLSGGTVPRPTAADLTAVRYRAASAPAAARTEALDPTQPAAPLDSSTTAEVDYAP